ncbi:16S rRNA (adenine(1518)-N(6)/adenine(1519)-N(6))-dimethyltransferase RsmA [Patescibacteria group bacterium]|nr:16S rRNA (adenine(1518)-N(6)/adenine(1519)-N(6))-dimethyltransferase RsmA [Patescibacteria group bacterium]MCL5004889.1 16S rRNA (adenine(1518)-N(6)/adenine(1519)-N(6))-dimethyltransferase RsmA [Patescibacteria group bacterium]
MEKNMTYAKKHLGQHFLKNKAKLRKIVDALELKRGDVVVEIGPGRGALTFPLAEKCKELDCKIIAIEKDKELASELKEKFKDNKNVEIIEGDALKEIKSQISNLKNVKIVGNIPYYITGYLFRIIGELERKPFLIVLLIQKEVAERVCAKPPKMNLLAASVQFWAEPKIIGYVSRKDFSPAPKVDSAIIKLSPKCSFSHSQECWNEQNKQNADNYYQFIKVLFRQPRKTAVNNISKFKNLNMTKEKLVEKLAGLGIKENARPQDLSVEQIIALSTLFS